MKQFKVVLDALRQTSAEEKIYYTSQVLLFMSLFFTWSTIVKEVEQSLNAFSSITGIQGLLIATLLAVHVFIIVYPKWKHKEVVSLNSKKLIPIYVSVTNFVLVFTALGTITKASWKFSELNIGNGVYLSLLFSLIALTYSILMKKKVTNVRIATPQSSEPESHITVPDAPKAESHSVLRNLP